MLKILRPVLLVVISLAVLGIGIVLFVKLSQFRKPPEQREANKIVPLVHGKPLVTKNIRLTVTGYGRIRAVRTLTVIPEVSGRIVYRHPHLRSGYFLKKGEVLVRIDSENYQIALAKAQADLESAQVRIQRIAQEQSNIARQIKVVTENTQLARETMQRIEKLLIDKVSSENEFDRARQAYLELVTRLVQLESQSALIPAQRKEAKASLTAAAARVREARLHLQRTRINVPFPARIITVAVEEGTLVGVSTPIATLEDYTAVEIPVIVPESQVQNLFGSTSDMSRLTRNEVQIAAKIYDNVGDQEHIWAGTVVRIGTINEQDLTVPVVVRVERPWSKQEKLPLATGKFVRVAIQGRQLRNVISVPRVALREDNTFHVIRQDRLHIIPIKILHHLQDGIVVDGDFIAGDIVVLSNLPLPVTGMKLRYVEDRQ